MPQLSTSTPACSSRKSSERQSTSNSPAPRSRDVISYICEVANLPILLDTRALNRESPATKKSPWSCTNCPFTRFSTSCSNVNQVELAWMEDGSRSDRDQGTGRSTETTQYYNVRDLLKNGYTHDRLIELNWR